MSPAAIRRRTLERQELLALPSEEFVTPKHSTAYGRLITGTQVEVGLPRYRAGEGAKEHAHPHEQILLVLTGKCRLTLDGKPTIIGSGMAALISPNAPHARLKS